MNAKIGRNEPCYCGSGKKYKKCCLALRPAPVPTDVIDFGWRQLRQLEGRVFDNHLSPYIMQELPKDVIQTAIADILPDDLPDTTDTSLVFADFLIPFLLFNWIPEDDFGVKSFDVNATLAQNYVNAHSEALNSQERRFIDTMNQTHYSFYAVLDVEVDKLLLVKDMLLGTMHVIKEQQGTHQLKRGDILYSRILTMDKQSIFVGMAPYLLPIDCHTDIIDFKAWLVEENDNQPLTPDSLRHTFNLDLLGYFFETLNASYSRELPTLFNTDGDLVCLSTSHFKLTIPPEAALKRLLPLTLSKAPEEFLQEAEREASGEIKRIEFPWLKKGNKKHKSWENTVMAHITVEEGKLILETNSEKRTQEGKKRLAKYLGDAIVFQHTLMESPEQKMQSLPKRDPKRQEEQAQLMAQPEIQAQLQAMAKAHWENWFDEPIPALKGQTPREAAKTEQGRERLEALLLQYEHQDLGVGDHPCKADMAYLKSELAIETD